jgi:hypothetical protein
VREDRHHAIELHGLAQGAGPTLPRSLSTRKVNTLPRPKIGAILNQILSHFADTCEEIVNASTKIHVRYLREGSHP